MRARGAGLVEAAIRCYPARWRRRHADEATELAALLIRDGAPAASIAWSYLAGAARAWLAPRSGRPLSTVAAALLAATCLLGFSAALIAETVPAKAAGTNQVPAGPVRPGPASAGPDSFTPCLPRPITNAKPAAVPGPPNIQEIADARAC